MTETTASAAPAEERKSFPRAELDERLARLRALLAKLHPEAGGLLACSKANLLWLAGTAGAGLVWVPLEGEPVLLLRKGAERARLESQVRNVVPFVSYRELAPLCAEAGSPLSPVIAVDKGSFTWAMGDMLASRLPGTKFVSGDDALARARARKTVWERGRLREGGRIHALVIDELLPARIRPGMTEAEIAWAYADEILRAGSDGIVRMNASGEEMFFGYASCGENSNHPTAYNGPLGNRGLSPAAPFLGNQGVVWSLGSMLAVDMGCAKDGYNTDRTQVYWPGTIQSVPAPILDAQKAAAEILESTLDRLKPGVTPAELWENARALAARLGHAEGFMGRGRDQLRFLGHGIGLNLDEWPAIARSFNEPLEEGAAVAIEPKISVPGHGMPGVEHSYLVGPVGPEPLTGSRHGILCLG